MSTESTQPPVVIHRLTKSAYAALAKQVTGVLPVVPADVLQSGFRCGVEFVLTKLRDGYVIDSNE